MVEKEKSINMELLRQHFAFPSPSVILKILYNVEDKKRNNELVNLFKSGLSDLKDEIKRISEDEIKIEILDEIVDIVEMILKFTWQNQEWQGQKILTPDQMFSKRTITLAQLKAGNNCESLENKIKQLLYSLYRSKKLTKAIYNNLISTI